MIKLIITDMDGTLLDEKGELPVELDQVMPKLREKGILFAAASGRQYYSLLNTFAEFQKEMLFFAENGTYVVYKGKELFSHTLPKDTVVEILNIAKAIPDIHIVLSGKKKAYHTSIDPLFEKDLHRYYVRSELVSDFSTVEDEFLKISIFDAKGAEFNSNRFFAGYRDKLQVAVSAPHWLDVMTLGTNKGMAVKKVQEHFHYTENETMVFGDYLNDLEMMSAAYYSYAMENAHPDVKQRARFIAKSNAEYGVIRAIQEKVLG